MALPLDLANMRHVGRKLATHMQIVHVHVYALKLCVAHKQRNTANWFTMCADLLRTP